METGAYNEAYVRRLLPGRRVALLTVAHRRLGLMVPTRPRQSVDGLHSLARRTFANRQPGSGTLRVWFDAQLAGAGD
ncbi:MAG: substrate-binding domain-containing protein [Anaerolineae bacterium]|nr:substrate-binding domain-containing protein [Anaerolineae bacterium]